MIKKYIKANEKQENIAHLSHINTMLKNNKIRNN